ncbi:hypothetical protein XA68_15346 [Ophiocordyceps unilateralis]|uniref:CN hydrolase domain-containing protein n=1 Tax=Ophiocordyceps unilateralis TaxID=268505 RepID=A0A2A9P8J5_OPHUN|nr:hypothetical protein XA68_15346 [Ophiocordyceps unilateralis]
MCPGSNSVSYDGSRLEKRAPHIGCPNQRGSVSKEVLVLPPSCQPQKKRPLVLTARVSMIRLGTASPKAQPSKMATLAQIARLANRAAALGIDLLLLPEALLGGYPRGSSFGCVVGHRSSRGRDEFASYFDAAVDLGDTVGDGAGADRRWLRRELGDEAESRRGDGTREELERIARESRVFLVVGCVEKAGGSLYCAVIYICPHEGAVGKRRKVMPTGAERLVWAQGCPSTLRAVSTTLRGTRVNLAAAICWENYMPLLRQSLYSQNINLYLAPTADSRDSWLSLVRTIAIEGRCFVVSSNMCEHRGPPRPPSSSSSAPLPASRGGSCIVSPFGDVLAGPQWDDDEGIISVDVDMRDCIRGRLDLDTAGSYSRGDSFKLTVRGLDIDPLPY